jgi:hypothetical protein
MAGIASCCTLVGVVNPRGKAAIMVGSTLSARKVSGSTELIGLGESGDSGKFITTPDKEAGAEVYSVAPKNTNLVYLSPVVFTSTGIEPR